jgi:acyl carrier protein
MSTIERVQSVVANVLRVPPERIVPGALLSDLADLDSLSLAEIASGLDEEFRTRVSADELTNVLSIADLVRVVERTPSRQR